MDVNFVYLLNLENSLEFIALDGLYHVLKLGQEEKWDSWIGYAEKLTRKEYKLKFKTLSAFIDGTSSSALFRPAVARDGLILGNYESFIKSYHCGESDFCDFI